MQKPKNLSSYKYTYGMSWEIRYRFTDLLARDYVGTKLIIKGLFARRANGWNRL